MRRVAALAAFGLALSVMREETLAVRPRAYPFYFYESTGANRFVLIDRTERAIEFDQETSKSAAVKALLPLKWKVLYPNSKGLITLLGSCLPDGHLFSLQHWYLPSPFRAYPGDTTLEPGLLQRRDTLIRNDFSPALDHEPHIYQHARREEGRP